MVRWAEGMIKLGGILLGAFIAAPFVESYLHRIEVQAAFSKVKADLATYRDAIDRFRLDCDRYPTDKEGFAPLLVKPIGLKGWDGPYLQRLVPLDPWARPYVYQATGPLIDNGYVVKSLGEDGRSEITDGSD